MERHSIAHLLTLTLIVITPHQFHSLPTLTVAGDQLIEYQPANGTRRDLATFQLCHDCRCCMTDDINNCSMMPCCYGIRCNLPDRPYDVCAFVPSACNCTSCV